MTSITVAATAQAGSASVTLAGGGFSDVLDVSVVALTLTGVSIDVANATFAANPSPPTA